MQSEVGAAVINGNAQLCVALKGLNELDETAGVAQFLAEAGGWAQRLLECEAACVMLVSLDGPDGALVRASEFVNADGAAAAGRHQLMTISACSAGAGGGSAGDRGLVTWAARINRSRRWSARAGVGGPGGSALMQSVKTKSQGSSTFVPEIDLIGLKVGGGGSKVPPRLSCVMCAPWPLPADTFFRASVADAGEVKSSFGRGARKGGSGEGRGATAQKAQERLSLVVVAVNKSGRASSERPSSSGSSQGGFNEADVALAEQCARHLAVRCSLHAARARQEKEADHGAAVAKAAFDLHSAPDPFEVASRAAHACRLMLTRGGHAPEDISVRFLAARPQSVGGGAGVTLAWQPAAGGVLAKVSGEHYGCGVKISMENRENGS